MKIAQFMPGKGPNVTPDVRRGDSFVPLEGEHVVCKARTEVLGIGERICWPDETHSEWAYKTRESLLVRCSGCLTSYTLTE